MSGLKILFGNSFSFSFSCIMHVYGKISAQQRISDEVSSVKYWVVPVKSSVF